MAYTWTSLGIGARSARCASGLSEAAPSASTDGLDLSDVLAFHVILRAPSGQTFDGTGSMLGYVYLNAEWVRAPRADFDMTELSGLEAGSMPSIPVHSPIGRYAFRPSSVGVSSGTTMTADYICSLRGIRGVVQG